VCVELVPKSMQIYLFVGALGSRVAEFVTTIVLIVSRRTNLCKLNVTARVRSAHLCCLDFFFCVSSVIDISRICLHNNT